MAKKYTVEDALKMIMDGNSSDMEQLQEGDDDDDDVEDEEWTPTAKIGENPDSSDDDDEENPDSSDDDESPEVPEDTTKSRATTLKQSARGNMKRKTYQRKRKQFEPPSVEFVECVEEDSEERLDWTLYMYFKDFVVINAWIRYRRDLEKLQPGQKPLPLQWFQASVGTALISAGKVKRCGRPMSSPEATPTPPRKRKTTEVPPDVRKDGLDHFPTWETRQRCKKCTGYFTHVFCQKCKVHLCLNKERNCFQAYHHAK
ncbi:uncharacterized protein LOC127531148 [Acanthochromis polyacanthus]|uniref:uncharacterized protein LOC127531148 n=1 Tax=Acanthochromis polyacanthus TaxID=80966 RepID=UPI00223439E9|nr:uncharacterized protein LOC127531148 [Acanthochromis polyacanthus]